jgi:hypothetical protein
VMPTCAPRRAVPPNPRTEVGYNCKATMALTRTTLLQVTSHNKQPCWRHPPTFATPTVRATSATPRRYAPPAPSLVAGMMAQIVGLGMCALLLRALC